MKFTKKSVSCQTKKKGGEGHEVEGVEVDLRGVRGGVGDEYNPNALNEIL